MLYIGLVLLIIGVVLFLIPMALNKWEDMAEVGFLLFCIGAFCGVAGTILGAIN